jgi:hypothetical protein
VRLGSRARSHTQGDPPLPAPPARSLDRPANAWCAPCKLAELHDLTTAPGGGAVAPHMFANHLQLLSRRLILFRQEDAHEFIAAFLDACERHCLHRERLPRVARTRSAASW